MSAELEPKFEPVIGLECHVQLSTHSKLFSTARAAFGGAPNAFTDPYTLALPGTLPVLNRAAVELALRLALATSSTVRATSRFARKHYFYPDSPKGYQITQYDEPIAEHGRVHYVLDGQMRSVRLTRIHIEEDAGKSLHAAGAATTLVDLNRAGVPLVEVVSEPELRSSEEAAEYLRALRQLVRWIDICDGNLEEGSLRCDANVSIRPVGQERLGTRVELKNINSFKNVQKAIEYEIARQRRALLDGERVVQETRLWDAERGTSHAMRSKEEANDYRYFPEPDLPPLLVDEAWQARVAAALPELPLPRRARYVAALGLTDADAELLTSDRAIADYFEAALAVGASARRTASWVGTELLGRLHADGQSLAQCPIAPAALGELVQLVDEGTLSGKLAKEVFDALFIEGGTPRAIVERRGLVQLSDEGALEAVAKKVIEANGKQVEKWRAGAERVFGFLVGQVMKETAGKANPEVVNAVLRRLLS